jgi:hypothetical protein
VLLVFGKSPTLNQNAVSQNFEMSLVEDLKQFCTSLCESLALLKLLDMSVVTCSKKYETIVCEM